MDRDEVMLILGEVGHRSNFLLYQTSIDLRPTEVMGRHRELHLNWHGKMDIRAQKPIDGVDRSSIDGVDYSLAESVAKIILLVGEPNAAAMTLLDVFRSKSPAVFVNVRSSDPQIACGWYISDVAIDLLVDGHMPGWISAAAKERLLAFRDELPVPGLPKSCIRPEIDPAYLNNPNFGVW